MKLALVVAASPDGVIGRGGGLPWILPGDLRRFRSITWGHPIVMGRRTHESIGRPLPGRLNIVVSRDPSYRAIGCVAAGSPAEAVAIATGSGAGWGMVVGGSAMYRALLPEAEVAHLTTVFGTFEGDVRFPVEVLRGPDWVVEHCVDVPADTHNGHATRYEVLRRVSPESIGRGWPEPAPSIRMGDCQPLATRTRSADSERTEHRPR